MFSCNATLDTTSETDKHHPSHHKALTRVDNATADSWTRKIDVPSLEGVSINRLFSSLLTNQSLLNDSIYLLGRENQVANEIQHLDKDKLTYVKSIL